MNRPPRSPASERAVELVRRIRKPRARPSRVHASAKAYRRSREKERLRRRKELEDPGR